MTPLRQRFIQDWQLRNRSAKTIAVYVMHVRNFALFFKESPERLGGEQVHRYLLHLLHEKKASWPQYNQAVSALRFLYTVTCPSDTVVTRLPYGNKKPFGGPEQVLKYLTAYTHRVALSNRRLVRMTPSSPDGERVGVRGRHSAAGTVTLTYKDYADGCRRKELTLPALEFVRRFALHIVPKGFVRVRHYGLLAHRDRGARLAKCRALLGASPATPPIATAAPAAPAAMAPVNVATGNVAAAEPCPGCGAAQRIMVWRAERPTARQLEQRWRWNTS